MDDENEDGTGCGCLGIIILIGLAIWGLIKFYDNYRYGEKRPFWNGTELVQVCKTPYYSSSECYKLNVTLLDEDSAQIHFKNGGYIISYDVTCYFTTDYNGYGKEKRYVFCRSWDENDQQWDFLPMDLVY